MSIGMVDICACGHARGSHLIRWGLPDQVRQQVDSGVSACRECVCSWYTHTVSAEDSDRSCFRVRPKAPRGNFGTGHPLIVGIAKASSAVDWQSLICTGCETVLTPQLALVLDSEIYCSRCFASRPEVYLGYGTQKKS